MSGRRLTAPWAALIARADLSVERRYATERPWQREDRALAARSRAETPPRIEAHPTVEGMDVLALPGNRPGATAVYVRRRRQPFFAEGPPGTPVYPRPTFPWRKV